jgi:predicted nucleic acid-binding protein
MGNTPVFEDGQIASVAKVGGLILMNRNHNDFNFLYTIKMENWHRE